MRAKDLAALLRQTPVPSAATARMMAAARAHAPAAPRRQPHPRRRKAIVLTAASLAGILAFSFTPPGRAAVHWFASFSPPSNGPFTQTTDPSQEDYYDQFDHAVDVEQIQHAAEDAFGQRFAGAVIDRSVTPNLFRVYVVDATPDDQATLAKIADGNPQVVLASAQVTEGQLARAKDAISRVLTQDGISPFVVGPELANQDVLVVLANAPDQSLQDQIAQAANGIKVRYETNPNAATVNPLMTH